MQNSFPHSQKLGKREKGKLYEKEVSRLLERNGYLTELIGGTSDFGVDIIAIAKDGKKIAVQCKSSKGNCGVYSVQEVYAGGRYYGFKRFAVVSTKGFSANAIKMARVLGVYLCDGKQFDYPDDISEYCEDILENYPSKFDTIQYEYGNGKRKLQTLCKENGISTTTVMRRVKEGMTIEEALKRKKYKRRVCEVYTVDGFTGNLREIGEKYGISSETLRHRIKFCGMSIEEAVSTPLKYVHNKLKTKP